MSATGIGATVRRKEDFRFITGKGQYTDDINRPGQSYIHFLRSPHAHAKIKSIGTQAAAAMPGVLAILTGADFAADKIGGLICGWMIHSKDGSPMKMAPHPAIAQRQGLLCRRPRRGGDRRDARSGTRRCRESHGRLRGAASGSRSRDRGERDPDPRGRAAQHDLPVAARRRQGGGAGLQVRRPCDEARPRQQPAGAQRHGAARRDRRLRRRHRELHPVEHDPESACRAARDCSLRRDGAGAQAAGDRTRRRRRLRLEDLHLSRRGRVPVGGEESRPSGQMGRRAQRIFHRRRPWARSRHPCRDGTRWQRQDHRVARQDHRQSRRLHVHVLFRGADLSLRDAAVGAVRHPAHLLRGRCGLYQHGAGRRLSRRRAPGSDLRHRAPARSQRAPARHVASGAAAQELRWEIPAPDAGDHELRRRRLQCLAQEGARARGRRTFRQAQARFRAPRQAARPWVFRLYRGVRHRAEPGGRLARRRRGSLGIRRGAGQPDR